METEKENLAELHGKIYEILQFLDKTCKEQGLTYYLAYGTLLGAVRHKGFIPWDDDIDVWMPRKDYMKLLEYLRTQNKDERFVLNEGEHTPKGDRKSEFQMRILDTNTIVSRAFASTHINACLWIDIFALDSFPQKKQRSFIKKFKKRLLWFKIARCKNVIFDNGSLLSKMNKLIYFLHNKWGFFKHTLIEEKEVQKTLKHLRKYENDERADRYFTYAAVYLPTPKKCVFEKEWFNETQEMPFESQCFTVPTKFHEILTTLYNDYMTIPKEHERHTHEVKAIESNDESNS